MKRKYVQGILFGVLFATAVSCSACGGKKDEAKKSGETVNAKENVVKKKEAVKLVLSEAKSLPDKVKDAEFSSADKKIATVTKNGVVHGVKRGKTTITMKSDKEVIHYQIKVAKHGMVYPKFTMLTGEHLDIQFSTKVKAKNVKWSSTNKKIATINKKGKIVAKKRGNVIIKGNDGKRTYVSKITVKKRPKNIVYLTFDDGPNSYTTPKVLNILKKNHVKATFFVIGKNVESNPEIVKRAYEEGHYIANHGYDHNNKELYKSEESFIKEIKKTDIQIGKAIGRKDYCSHIFRFPNGYMSKQNKEAKKKAVKLLNDMNYTYIDWNSLNNDSIKKYNKTELLNNLKKYSKNKGTLVILMHDTKDVSDSSKALEDSIKYLKNQGYKFENFYNLISE